ncbi:hypothetical protein PMI23_04917 [Pseudomonas sp. GM24]|nr:hypothetical protein PMI19_02006 [Pseudomonas sp. GM16]EJM29924.1 hypothetical protein PMI23_04917 [Pseudomonas sp. GM24]
MEKMILKGSVIGMSKQLSKLRHKGLWLRL